jgi:hypothetical protein
MEALSVVSVHTHATPESARAAPATAGEGTRPNSTPPAPNAVTAPGSSAEPSATRARSRVNAPTSAPAPNSP